MNRSSSRTKLAIKAERDAIEVRLRYFALKGRRDPKSLTRAELDELCTLVAASAPVDGPSWPEAS